LACHVKLYVTCNVQGLQARYDQLDKWLSTIRLRSFWLGGFLQPQGFLATLRHVRSLPWFLVYFTENWKLVTNSHLQDAVRKHAGWAFEDVKLHADIYIKDGDAHK
jgi:hypothetical protein